MTNSDRRFEIGLSSLSAFILTVSLYPIIGSAMSILVGVLAGVFMKAKFAFILAMSVLAWMVLITTFSLMVTVISMIVILALLYTLLPI
jgi:hypothetical protein